MTTKHEEELEQNGHPSNSAKQCKWEHSNSAQGRHIQGKTKEHAMKHSTYDEMGCLETISQRRLRRRAASGAEQRVGTQEEGKHCAKEQEEELEQNSRTKNKARHPESEHDNVAQGQHTLLNYNEHGKAVKKAASLSRKHNANHTGLVHHCNTTD